MGETEVTRPFLPRVKSIIIEKIRVPQEHVIGTSKMDVRGREEVIPQQRPSA